MKDLIISEDRLNENYAPFESWKTNPRHIDRGIMNAADGVLRRVSSKCDWESGKRTHALTSWSYGHECSIFHTHTHTFYGLIVCLTTSMTFAQLSLSVQYFRLASYKETAQTSLSTLSLTLHTTHASRFTPLTCLEDNYRLHCTHSLLTFSQRRMSLQQCVLGSVERQRVEVVHQTSGVGS